MSLFAVCCVPAGALRKNPAHEAEMTSQLLFGDCVQVLERVGGDWAKVRCRADGYEGWCQQSHLTAVEPLLYEQSCSVLAGDWVNEVLWNGHPLHIPLGCFLTGLHGGQAQWLQQQWQYAGTCWQTPAAVPDAATLRQVAFRFLNTPYLWGGKSVFGTDCSGFTQTVFRFFNITLPRDARQQAELGEPVDFLQQARCGDLAFFDNDEGAIIHVGILLGPGEIIHAAGKVRVDKIDNAGIISTDTGLRSHTLRIIKRIC